MGSPTKHRSDNNSPRHHGLSPTSSPKHKHRSTHHDDWADVKDPEERRRIQNRIAQRKFREKARENKERAERDARNRDNAANIYHVPTPDEIPGDGDEELSGLPWGSISLKYVITRGHDSESKKSSGTRSGGSGNAHGDTQYLSPYVDTFAASASGPHQPHNHQQAPSYPFAGGSAGGSNDGRTAYYDDDSRFAYGQQASPSGQPYNCNPGAQ